MLNPTPDTCFLVSSPNRNNVSSVSVSSGVVARAKLVVPEKVTLANVLQTQAKAKAHEMVNTAPDVQALEGQFSKHTGCTEVTVRDQVPGQPNTAHVAQPIGCQVRAV